MTPASVKNLHEIHALLGEPMRPKRRRRQIESLDEFLNLSPTKYAPGAFRAVLRRDSCAYCGQSGGTIDHIDPKAGGGPDAVTNLTGACVQCNRAKGRTPLLHFLGSVFHFASPPARRPDRLVCVAWLSRGRGRCRQYRQRPFRLPKEA